VQQRDGRACENVFGKDEQMKTLKAILGLLSIPFWILWAIVFFVFVIMLKDVFEWLVFIGDLTLRKLGLSK